MGNNHKLNLDAEHLTATNDWEEKRKERGKKRGRADTHQTFNPKRVPKLRNLYYEERKGAVNIGECVFSLNGGGTGSRPWGGEKCQEGFGPRDPTRCPRTGEKTASNWGGEPSEIALDI